MSTKQNYNPKLIKIGELLTNKRKALGDDYKSRDNFISQRSVEVFNGEDWISLRHLLNIETGRNWISIEKLILLSAALEEDPVDLFAEILETYKNA